MFKKDEAQQAVVAILDHIYNLRGKANLRPRPDLLSAPRLCESSFLNHLFLFHQLLGAGDPFRLQRYDFSSITEKCSPQNHFSLRNGGFCKALRLFAFGLRPLA